jgi:hypothetical protein
MTAATFDTLKFVRRLRDDETFTPQQAERLADALSEAVRDDIATKQDVDLVRTDLRAEIAALRTELKGDIAALRAELKGDIAELRTELKGDIAGLRAELKADMAETKAEILKWMFGAIGFQTVLILGAVIALIRIIHP